MARPSDDEGFVGATLVGDEGRVPEAFDASAYSFFGAPSNEAGGLEDELEAGLEAPPEEDAAVYGTGDEGLLDDFEEDEDEDLSLAGLFSKGGGELADLGLSEARLDETEKPLRLQDLPRLTQQPGTKSMALGGLLASGDGGVFYTPSPPASVTGLRGPPPAAAPYQPTSTAGHSGSIGPSPLGQPSSGPILGPPLLGQQSSVAPSAPALSTQQQQPIYGGMSGALPGPPGYYTQQQPVSGAPPPPVGLSASALEAALLSKTGTRAAPPQTLPGLGPPPPSLQPPVGGRNYHPGPPGFPGPQPPPPGMPPGMASVHPPTQAPYPQGGPSTRPGSRGWANAPHVQPNGPRAPHQLHPMQFPVLGAQPPPPPPPHPRPAVNGPRGQAQQSHGQLEALVHQRLQGLTLNGHEQYRDAGGLQRVPHHHVPRRRLYNGQYMTGDEIDAILYSQMRGIQQAPPYLEDYYYQGFVNRYYNCKNRRIFAPETVRELAPTEKLGADEVAFVDLEGLGRVPFSNIRRPRPLMDVAAEEVESAAPGKRDRRRRLDQEPLLAARIMIEDCNCLILDVQDIDRIFIAAANAAIPDEAALRSRRRLLLDGLAASLRLPDTPAGNPKADAVFCRLMALRKGRILAARALEITLPPAEERQRPVPLAPCPPNLLLLWAALRNAPLLWPEDVPAADEAAASIRAASAAARLLAALPSAQHVADAGAALAACAVSNGGKLPALDAPVAALGPSVSPGMPWLGEIVVALLRRAKEVRLGSGGEDGVPPQLVAARAAWAPAFGTLESGLRAQLSMCVGSGLRNALTAAINHLS